MYQELSVTQGLEVMSSIIFDRLFKGALKAGLYLILHLGFLSLCNKMCCDILFAYTETTLLTNEKTHQNTLHVFKESLT